MNKKISADLMSLAHDVLRIKDKEDVFVLKQKAYELHEKLAVLAYIEEYLRTDPKADEQTKNELISELKKTPAFKEKIKKEEVIHKEEPVKSLKEISSKVILDDANTKMQPDNEKGLPNKTEKVTEEQEKSSKVILESTDAKIESDEKKELQDEIEKVTEEQEKEKIIIHTLNIDEEQQEENLEKTKQPEDDKLFAKKSLSEEKKQDTDSKYLKDLFTNLDEDVKNDVKDEETKDFDNKKTLTLEDELQDTLGVDVMANLFEKAETKKTLNDKLQNTIQIGLNDRIAFVNNLFNGNQIDYNRVISQLNTLNTQQEAEDFINQAIRPDYNWNSKEEYERRFLEIIERRFTK